MLYSVILLNNCNYIIISILFWVVVLIGCNTQSHYTACRILNLSGVKDESAVLI